MNFNQFSHIFEENKSIIYDLMKINSVVEFYQVFDHDNDGILNEDE